MDPHRLRKRTVPIVARDLQEAEHGLLLVLPGSPEHARLVSRVTELTDELLALEAVEAPRFRDGEGGTPA